MDTFKLIIILVCALVALETTNAKVLNSNLYLTRNSKNVGDNVQAAIKELDKIITATQLNSYNILRALVLFEEEANKMLKKSDEILTDQFNYLHKTVLEFEEKAEEQNVDIEECVNNWEGSVKDNVMKTKVLLRKTVENFAGKHMNAAYQLAVKIITSKNKLEGYALDAWFCDNDDCLRKVLAGVKELEGYVMDELTDDINAELTEVRENGDSIIKNSYIVTLAFCVEVMIQLTEDFKKCANDKLDQA